MSIENIMLCDHPVFIIGSPRSGTSILAWSLAQHGQLWTSAESDILYHLYGNGHLAAAFQKGVSNSDGSWFAVQQVGRAEFYRCVGLGLNALFTSRSGGKRWVDQSPTYTLMAEDLVEIFPGAYFVHILRDGRSVVNSMINSRFDEDWAKGFTQACQVWAHYAGLGLQLAAHCPDRCLTVQNETLSADPAGTFQTIFEFMDLPAESSPADYFRTHRINSSFRTAGRDQARTAGDIWAEWTADQRTCFLRESGRAMLAGRYFREEELSDGVIQNGK